MKHNKIIIAVSSIFIGIIFSIIIHYIIKANHNRYKLYADINDVESLGTYFLISDRHKDGTDSTGGIVDYQYCVPDNLKGKVSVAPITNCPLIYNTDNGFIIKVGTDQPLQKTPEFEQAVPSVRLVSKNSFKGGLYIYDIEHLPYGPSVWPAIFYNGMQFSSSQMHNDNLKNNPDKLSDIVQQYGTICSPHDSYWDVSCIHGDPEKGDKYCASHTNFKPDSYKNTKPGFSNPAGKKSLGGCASNNLCMSTWPDSGEIDMIEYAGGWRNDKNLMSIYGPPNCEVSTKINLSTNWVKNELGGPTDPRSCCRANRCNNKLTNKFGRKSCDVQYGENPINGMCHIDGFSSTVGYDFNKRGGGIYAFQWIPDDSLYIFLFGRESWTQKQLENNNMPLSKNPQPSKWYTLLNKNFNPQYQESYGSKNVLIGSINLKETNTMMGCPLNLMQIVINITLGAGFSISKTALGQGSRVDGYSHSDFDSLEDYIQYYTKRCYSATKNNTHGNTSAFIQKGDTKLPGFCTSGTEKDGPYSNEFFQEAYFKFKQIKIFTNNNDKNIFI